MMLPGFRIDYQYVLHRHNDVYETPARQFSDEMTAMFELAIEMGVKLFLVEDGSRSGSYTLKRFSNGRKGELLETFLADTC